MSTDAVRRPTPGVMAPRDLPAAELVPFARAAEQAGFEELWIVEDLGFHGGVTQAATALASTSTIRVGLGILPVATRNVAFAAMELASLADLFPGRVVAGIGHGVPTWIRQVGAWPASPLTLFSEYAAALTALLRGERVTTDGRYVSLADVGLESPPATPPPVVAGVRGPKSLAVARDVLDGVVLAEPSAAPYVAQARSAVGPAARLVVFAFAALDDDGARARELVRPLLAGLGDAELSAHVDPLPFAADLRALRARHASGEWFAADLPDVWVDALTLAGTAADVRARIDDLGAAGADTVVLIPVGGADAGTPARLAGAVR
ncbi:MAG: luciferase [Pseudonocardia sp. SCN 72-86]|nr:MAG: luciferase [Pseudonocardia sp. SCN 72-86]